MRIATIAIALVAAGLIGCGDPGPAPVIDPVYGELMDCDIIVERDDRGSYETRDSVPTQPGEVILLTVCYGFEFDNGVPVRPKTAPPDGCVTVEYVAETDVFDFMCTTYVFYGSGDTDAWGANEFYIKRTGRFETP